MATVKLSDELVNEAKRYAKVESRPVPKQERHLGRCARLQIFYGRTIRIIGTYLELELGIMLLAVGQHENFYRDLKRD